MRITESQCEQLANISEVIDVVGQAFNSDHFMVPKVYIDCDNGDFRAMPARIGNVAGVKWVSVFPENSSKDDLSTVMATIFLNSADTGELLAIVDGTHITKLRTAAAAAIATRLLSREDSKVAAFVGCGGQTKLHLEAICQARDIETVSFFDINQEAAEALADQFSDQFSTVVTSSVFECIEDADIITTLTPSTEPILLGEWVSSGVHINAMGADAKGKREMDNELYHLVNLWVVDDIQQATHSGETQHVSEAPNWNSDVEELSSCDGRNQPNQITLFDSTGLAIQDIAVANYVYNKLKHAA